MHQCTGVRKTSSSHALFFTACPNALARAFCELIVTFSLPNPSSLLCHRALPQDLTGRYVTLPLCFPKCVTPGTTSLFSQEQGTCTSQAAISLPCHAHSEHEPEGQLLPWIEALTLPAVPSLCKSTFSNPLQPSVLPPSLSYTSYCCNFASCLG